jgi:hypothetical protein
MSYTRELSILNDFYADCDDERRRDRFETALDALAVLESHERTARDLDLDLDEARIDALETEVADALALVGLNYFNIKAKARDETPTDR